MFFVGIARNSAKCFISQTTRIVSRGAATNTAMDTSKSDKFGLPKRYQGSAPSVWVEYIQLASEYKPLNLGQGFTDYPVPEFIRKALEDAATSSNPLMNQYTRGFGHPRLVQALAELYSKVTNRKINPMSEVLVTVGAYEALYASIQGNSYRLFETII